MNILHPHQEEKLREIGLYLQRLRQEKSVSIEEIAAKTHIQLRMLKALEQGELTQLPAPIYVQGFIRRYGDLLGLDGHALAKTLPTDSITEAAKTELNEGDSKLNASELPAPKFEPFSSKPNGKTGLFPSTRSILLYLPYILVGIAAMGGLFYFLNKPSPVKSVSPNKKQPVAQQHKAAKPAKKVAKPLKSSPIATNLTPAKPKNTAPRPTTSPSLQSSPSPSIPGKPISNQPNSSPIQISLELQDDSWVRIVADGKTQFEGILKKGEKQTWTAKEKLTVRSGNAGAILLSLNQKKPESFGKLGRIKQTTFTTNSEKSSIE